MEWLIYLTHLEIGVTDMLFDNETNKIEEENHGTTTPMKLNWVYGDIKHLSILDQLLFVNLSQTLIHGNLSVFKETPKIKSINLKGCLNIIGSIKVVTKLIYLESLLLGGTSVSGDIKALSKLDQLEKLDLGLTYVQGSLNCFYKLKKLLRIDLQETMCDGKIDNFQKLSSLEVCNIRGSSSITGDISVFKQTPYLQEVCLNETSCSGDIIVFENTPRLRSVRLARTLCGIDAHLQGGRLSERLHHNKPCPIRPMSKGNSVSSGGGGGVITRGSDGSSRVGTVAIKYENGTMVRQGASIYGSIDVFGSTPRIRAIDLHSSNCTGNI